MNPIDSSASYWLQISTSLEPTGKSSAADASTIESSSSSNSSSDNRIVEQSKRVFLRPKLSYKQGDWEEIAPEDVLSSAIHLSSLSMTILQSMSTRVRMHGRSVSSINSLRTSCSTMLQLLSDCNTSLSKGDRSIVSSAAKAIGISGFSLVHPIVFGPSLTSADQTCISTSDNLLPPLSACRSYESVTGLLNTVMARFDRDTAASVWDRCFHHRDVRLLLSFRCISIGCAYIIHSTNCCTIRRDT